MRELIDCLDLTLLDAAGDLDGLLARASEHNPAAICVLPTHVAAARKALPEGIGLACAAGGFPNGDGPIDGRIEEIGQAIADGADEIDVVLDFTALMDGDLDKVVADLVAIRAACEGVLLKVILETPELDLAQVELGARLALEFGADFVKTCTGRRGGVSLPVTRLLAEFVSTWNAEHPGESRGLKLSGGLRDAATALEHVAIVRTAMGGGFVHPATFRIGASSLLDDLI